MPHDPFKELDQLLGFELWLSTWVPIAIVGQARHSCQCPLACYLQQATGETVIVARDAIGIGGERRDHTPLSKALLLCVDDARGNHQPITAKQTRTALTAARRLVAAAQKERRN